MGSWFTCGRPQMGRNAINTLLSTHARIWLPTPLPKYGNKVTFAEEKKKPQLMPHSRQTEVKGKLTVLNSSHH
jgi:hypothetical protein